MSVADRDWVVVMVGVWGRQTSAKPDGLAVTEGASVADAVLVSEREGDAVRVAVGVNKRVIVGVSEGGGVF